MEDRYDDIYIEKALNGDSQAFSVIVSRYQDRTFSIVFRILRNREDAEDLTQDIFLKVYKSLARFKKESKLSTWIYRIAYNTTISELRKRKINFTSIDNVQLEENQNIDNPIMDIIKEERIHCLNTAMQTLSPEDIFLISLYYTEEKSIDEIALITENSSANTKVKLFRIRKKLAVEINKLMQHE